MSSPISNNSTVVLEHICLDIWQTYDQDVAIGINDFLFSYDLPK